MTFSLSWELSPAGRGIMPLGLLRVNAMRRERGRGDDVHVTVADQAGLRNFFALTTLKTLSVDASRSMASRPHLWSASTVTAAS